MAALADGEALVAAALASGEWKEEVKQSSGKRWYWRRSDKLRARNREELAAILAAEGGAPGAAPSAFTGGDGVAPAGGEAAAPAAGAVTGAEPDARLMASMGLLGSAVEDISDPAELRNHVKMWEAKYKVLLEENRRLLTAGGGGGAVGSIVPSDLQLKYDALLRANQALQQELELRRKDVDRLSAAVEELSDSKAKLEIALAEQYQQSAEQHDDLLRDAAAAKQKLAEQDAMMSRASDFVNSHYAEQNRFLTKQVAELTGLLHKAREEGSWAAQIRSFETTAADTIAVTSGERAEIATHFAALLNSPARHVLSPGSAAAISRLLSGERDTSGLPRLHSLPEPHHDLSAAPRPGESKHEASLRLHYARQSGPQQLQIAPAAPPERAVLPLSEAPPQPVHMPPPAGLGAPGQAVGVYEGFIVRARQR
eukprot:TRINITY_DN41111_c0_g1_i1.p1 TRINITY_DN41111_c0_g1~~TRINITY_DN41111_c0_g1_i1.p1  ORF type:complete len:452 (+),score=174.07 TRINITY_DN41111_c0_g1_i1:79-1356(+)